MSWQTRRWQTLSFERVRCAPLLKGVVVELAAGDIPRRVLEALRGGRGQAS